MLKIVLADSEPQARRRLRHAVEREPSARVVAECADGRSAVRAAEEADADLLLLDVDMPELDGISVARLSAPHRAVVFVTAHAQYAVHAYEVGAVDYILKPFSEARLRAALHRAGQYLAGRRRELSGGEVVARIQLRTGGRVVFRAVAEIVRLEAEGNYTRVVTESETYVVRATLGSFAGQLSGGRFVRAHKSHMVNVCRIRELISQGGSTHVVMTDGVQVPVGRAHRWKLLRGLGSHPGAADGVQLPSSELGEASAR